MSSFVGGTFDDSSSDGQQQQYFLPMVPSRIALDNTILSNTSSPLTKLNRIETPAIRPLNQRISMRYVFQDSLSKLTNKLLSSSISVNNIAPRSTHNHHHRRIIKSSPAVDLYIRESIDRRQSVLNLSTFAEVVVAASEIARHTKAQIANSTHVRRKSCEFHGEIHSQHIRKHANVDVMIAQHAKTAADLEDLKRIHTLQPPIQKVLADRRERFQAQKGMSQQVKGRSFMSQEFNSLNSSSNKRENVNSNGNNQQPFSVATNTAATGPKSFSGYQGSLGNSSNEANSNSITNSSNFDRQQQAGGGGNLSKQQLPNNFNSSSSSSKQVLHKKSSFSQNNLQSISPLTQSSPSPIPQDEQDALMLLYHGQSQEKQDNNNNRQQTHSSQKKFSLSTNQEHRKIQSQKQHLQHNNTKGSSSLDPSQQLPSKIVYRSFQQPKHSVDILDNLMRSYQLKQSQTTADPNINFSSSSSAKNVKPQQHRQTASNPPDILKANHIALNPSPRIVFATQREDIIENNSPSRAFEQLLCHADDTSMTSDKDKQLKYYQGSNGNHIEESKFSYSIGGIHDANNSEKIAQYQQQPSNESLQQFRNRYISEAVNEDIEKLTREEVQQNTRNNNNNSNKNHNKTFEILSDIFSQGAKKHVRNNNNNSKHATTHHHNYLASSFSQPRFLGYTHSYTAQYQSSLHSSSRNSDQPHSKLPSFKFADTYLSTSTSSKGRIHSQEGSNNNNSSNNNNHNNSQNLPVIKSKTAVQNNNNRNGNNTTYYQVSIQSDHGSKKFLSVLNKICRN